MTASSLDLYRWLVVARALDRALCAENPRWFPIEGEEATVVGSVRRPPPDRRRRAPLPRSVRRLPDARRRDVAAGRPGAAQGRRLQQGPLGAVQRPVRAAASCPGWPATSAPPSGRATGAALAFQDEGSDRVCVCAFGDGTANRGDFHENVNLAACWKLPDRLRLPAQRLGDLRSRPRSTCRPRSSTARPATASPAWRRRQRRRGGPRGRRRGRRAGARAATARP